MQCCKSTILQFLKILNLLIKKINNFFSVVLPSLQLGTPSKSKPCLFHLYILWLSPGQLNNPSISFPVEWLFSIMNFFGQWINVHLPQGLSPLPESSYSLTIPQVKTRWLRVTPKRHTVRAKNKPCCLDHQDFRMLCHHSLAPPIMMDKSLRLNIILRTWPLPEKKKIL